MGITNLGAVGISAGGVYNSETVYKKYKVVSANGGSYMYINPTPAAGVPVTETSHWQQIADKGDKGDTGAKIVTAAWSGNDLLLTLDDTSTITLTGAKTTLKGDPGDISNIKVDGATKTKAAGVVDLTSDFARYALWRKTPAGNPVSAYPVPESPLYPKVSGMFAQAGTGDPSPSNIRPITPWMASGGTAKMERTGKNLLKTPLLQGYIGLDGNLAPGVNNVSSDYRPITGGYAYTVRCNTQIAYIGYAFYDKNKVFISPRVKTANVSSLTFTVPLNAAYVRVFYEVASITPELIIGYKPQLELGSVATPYEPYSGAEITLTAPQEIPAGWMDNEGNGQVTKNLLTINFAPNSVTTDGYTETVYAIFSVPGAVAGVGACSHLPHIGSVGDTPRHYCVTGLCRMFIPRSVLAEYTVAGVLAWLQAQETAGTPVRLLYNLATPTALTPITTPLTALPQLDRITPRQNVLTASTGNIELTYAKSPTRESDEIRAAIIAHGGTL